MVGSGEEGSTDSTDETNEKDTMGCSLSTDWGCVLEFPVQAARAVGRLALQVQGQVQVLVRSVEGVMREGFTDASSS